MTLALEASRLGRRYGRKWATRPSGWVAGSTLVGTMRWPAGGWPGRTFH
jgi:hypothetical protein